MAPRPAARMPQKKPRTTASFKLRAVHPVLRANRVRRDTAGLLPHEAQTLLRARSAASRVRRAASKFGPEQGSAASAWVKQAIAAPESATDPLELMRAQVDLFGECLRKRLVAL